MPLPGPVTLLTPASNTQTLRGFVKLIQPGGAGWNRIKREALAEGIDISDTTEKDQLPVALLNVLLASIAVYGALFAIGYGLYGNRLLSVTLAVTSLCCTALVINLWRGNQPGPD